MVELVAKSGWVGWPLVLCSVVTLAIVLERFWTLRSLLLLEERAVSMLSSALERGDLVALRSAELASAPVAQVLSSLTGLRARSEETLLRAAEIALAKQRLRLRRYLGTLATIANTAPFIGLFGTVWGILHAFGAMGGAQANTDNSTLMIGISEALSATALGLMVAVPSVIAYNYFLGRVQVVMLTIQEDVTRLVPLVATAAGERREKTHAG